ncbi:FAD dependent oxidoreductase-2 [Coleophoma cylindrospora]|uniref:FAD dependent oxidoreductase-2 n=1 Tax=Coleophoma cylindrospora TaxID=1849047 RepID=A0A3D8Q502_9HELO|nr:FAD dependent oxidoreductase-2 [Coleophoma cylindrospora]
MAVPPSKISPIIIVGAGAFGLSTALHLAHAGYSNVTVVDYQPYDEIAYSTALGADAASADMNKVLRLSYGSEILYQRLAFDSLEYWNAWNEQISQSAPEQLPKGLKPTDKIWNNCGYLRMSLDEKLSEHEEATLLNLTAEGLRDTQYILGNQNDDARARSKGLTRKFDPMLRKARGKSLTGVFDSTAGFVEASKCCTWAMHLAKQAGVKFVLGHQGRMTSFLKKNGRTCGIMTADGQRHKADLVVLAAGAWTPSILPSLAPLLETTAGSVAYFQLPPQEQAPELWERFSPANFPVYAWGGWSKGAGLGGFPRTETGILKIGFRGTKYTNYETVVDEKGDEHRISVPKTAWWPRAATPQITKQAAVEIKDFVKENLPELADLGIAGCRNCWYTDSLDNNFVIDWVPDDAGLVICSGGSGHGFKFLPILGREVVKIIENPTQKNEYGKMWAWRTQTNGPRNGLEDGEGGSRVLSKQKMATKEDWKFSETAKL